MKRRNRITIAVAIATLILGGSYWYFIQYCLPHFHTVREGTLYRSGQPRGVGLEWLRVRGIRTLINLRDPDKDGVAEEKAFAEENGLRFYQFPIGSSHEATQDAVKRFLAIVDDKSPRPILVHCSRGKDRSNVLSAIFRIEYDRWSNELALEELYRLGLTMDSLPAAQNFIRNYRPRWAGGGGTATNPSQALPEVPWQE